MARLLADTKERIEKSLESDYDLNRRTEAEILLKLARERGADSLLEKMRRLRKEREEAEEALGKLGFDCSDYNDTLIGWSCPRAARTLINSESLPRGAG